MSRAFTSYLLDTNVISETRKSRPNENVLAFLEGIPSSRTFLSVLTMGELRKGIAAQRMRIAPAVPKLQSWVEFVEREYTDRTLLVDQHIAHIWGEISTGRTRPIIDTLLAATAIHHRLTLVTRNVRDVEDLPVKVHNPWLA